ncbi:hypothetical protein M422DRAFT_48832 [Sphaerobolus stellatus SS14]|uniref:Uncharacterized protein n=1 Tax=Sphaerobolus stellatus (strain SS14) TaxID=990650 RepID=A0A0C9VI07_SPHS4|nr:hypothetical protein M422DRAFT_48832 [Sphaerobolus stellatus SS14]
MPIEELRTLILGLPNLTELMIGTTELLSDVMDVLNNNLNLDICPKLTTLKFYYCKIDPDALDKMLRSREKLPGQPDRANFLRYFEVQGGRWFDQNGNATGGHTDHCSYIKELQDDYPLLAIGFEFNRGHI